MKTKKAGLYTFFSRHSNSISRKYSQGYILILLSALLIFIISFYSNHIVSNNYKQEMDDLFMLNKIYVDVGNVKSMSTNINLMINSERDSTIRTEIMNTRQSLGHLNDRMDEDYTREVVDLCCMVETYLEQTEAMLDFVMKNMESDGIDLFSVLHHPGFVILRDEAQNTNTYIEYSFSDIYPVKLKQTEKVQQAIDTFRLTMSIIQVIIVLAALGGCILFYQRVVKGISRSVAQLTQFTKDIRRDPSISRRVSIQTGDEIELFAVSFNEMLDQMQRQISEIEVNSQIREKLADAEVENLRVVSILKNNELKFLQSRINPHFLFNTLNMIVQTAIIEEAHDTARLLETTAELLRYSLRKLSFPVSMADELESIKNYLIIQQNRFGDRLLMHIDVEDQCLSQQIPCMILQPLIENAITHGIGQKVDGGQVQLRIFQKEKHCCFEIEDNGVGIPAEKLEDIKSMFLGINEKTSSIGIKNVYQRLMLFYQQDVVFEILSCHGKTLIHVALPLKS